MSGLAERVTMRYAISSTTNMFELSKEDENYVNPIHGQSLLLWLREKAKDTVEMDESDTEDWGWYTSIDWKGRAYLPGASAEESDDPEIYWVFQIDKHRTLKEKLLGREKMSEDDECWKYFRSLIESESGFNNVAPA